MKGVFSTPPKKYGLCLFNILAGLFIAVRFGTWGLEAVQSGKIAAALFCFGTVILGLLLGVFAIFLFNNNKGAYLTVDDQKIEAQFGFGTKICEDISEIRKVALSQGGTGIELYFTRRYYWVPFLANARDIYNYIITVNPWARFAVSSDEAASDLVRYKKKCVKCIVLTVVFSVLLFAQIACCALLTGGKDIGDFSQKDDLIFIGFTVAELITVAALFWFAGKCAKYNKFCKMCREALLSNAATEHKNDSLERYRNIIDKRFFNDNTYRIVIYALADDAFAYTLERFELASNTWIKCYETAAFHYLSELYDNIDETFYDVILEE